MAAYYMEAKQKVNKPEISAPGEYTLKVYT